MPANTGTQYVFGRGAVFSISTDGTTYTPVNQLKTINFSGGKADLEDITNMQSAGAFREYAPTLLDSGQASISGVFDPHDAGQTMLHASFLAFTQLQCKLVYSPMNGDLTGFTRKFSAYVTESNLDAQFDKTSTLTGTMKITGPITDTTPTVGS